MADLSENEAKFREFVGSRLNAKWCVVNDPDDLACSATELESLGYTAKSDELEFVSRSVFSDSAAGIDSSTPGEYLVAAKIPGQKQVFVSLLPGSLELGCQLVDNLLDGFELHSEVLSYKAAMEESAMQLAQSFEEQNWLRGFAQRAVRLTQNTSANDVAAVILQPLGYLLRAQSVFLIVNVREKERSGLESEQYGESGFTTQVIEGLLAELGFNNESPPLVRNNVSINTQDGIIQSLVAVNIQGASSSVGCIVGINRSTETHSDGLPVYDPEFGSGDVGLLEEAGVLLATQTHNIHLLTQSNQLFLGSLHAMSSSIDARDPYTQGHSERVARLSFDIAKIMHLSDEACQEIYLSGILHDIGKIGIPDAVLLKNGSLTDDEFRTIQKHPEIGYRIVERLGHMPFVLPGVLHHHERWDGKGYPHHLAGEAIPLMARVIAVADAFDAMTSSRPYRNAMPLQKASSIILSGKGIQWDADIVDCFHQWLRERHSELAALPEDSNSIIPIGSPMEQMVHAVMSLGF